MIFRNNQIGNIIEVTQLTPETAKQLSEKVNQLNLSGVLLSVTRQNSLVNNHVDGAGEEIPLGAYIGISTLGAGIFAFWAYKNLAEVAEDLAARGFKPDMTSRPTKRLELCFGGDTYTYKYDSLDYNSTKKEGVVITLSYKGVITTIRPGDVAYTAKHL